MSTPAIETAGLTKFYGAHRGIEGLGLRIEQGEVFGYLGPNGAGKTTTIRLLLDRTRAISVGAALAVAAWIFDGLAQAVDALEPFRQLEPWYHALGKDPLGEGASPGSWALLLVATVVFVAVAAYGLERRDVRQ